MGGGWSIDRAMPTSWRGETAPEEGGMSLQLSVVGKTWAGIVLALAAGAITAVVSVRQSRSRQDGSPVVAPATAVADPLLVDDAPLLPAARSDSLVHDALSPLSP